MPRPAAAAQERQPPPQDDLTLEVLKHGKIDKGVGLAWMTEGFRRSRKRRGARARRENDRSGLVVGSDAGQTERASGPAHRRTGLRPALGAGVRAVNRVPAGGANAESGSVFRQSRPAGSAWVPGFIVFHGIECCTDSDREWRRCEAARRTDRSRTRREIGKKLRVPLDAIFGAHKRPPRPMAAPPTVRKRLGLRGRGSAPLSGPPGAVSPPSRTRTNQLFSIPWYTYEYE